MPVAARRGCEGRMPDPGIADDVAADMEMEAERALDVELID